MSDCAKKGCKGSDPRGNWKSRLGARSLARAVDDTHPDSRNRTIRQFTGRGERSERGASLILALVFIVSISLIVGALTDWATNDLNNTTHFQNTSARDYSATSAVELAIQSMRFNPLYSETQSPDLGYCWTPSGSGGAGTTYLSQLETNGYTVAVWCDTQFNIGNSNDTRIVTFYACLSQSPSNNFPSQASFNTWAVDCFAKHLLIAEVAFGDEITGQVCSPPGCGALAATWLWSWGNAAGSTVGTKPNSITISTSAPINATVGGPMYHPVATATSGDVVSVTSATMTVCTVVSQVVSFASNGQCTLNFSDPGNATYEAASATQSFNVTGGTTTTTTSTTTTTTSSTTTTTIAGGTYAGCSSNGGCVTLTDMANGTYYYLINGGSAGSATTTGNPYAPGVQVTLTGLTFTMGSTSGSNHAATVQVITGGVASPTGLSCTVTGGSGLTSCHVGGSVTVPATSSINIQGLGNGNHTGSWSVTYVVP